MSEAFKQVIQNPRSIGARRQLAAAWAATGDPRAELLRLELEDLDGNSRSGERAARLEYQNGRDLAGDVASQVEHFSFELGLVGGIGLRAADFKTRSQALFQMAPIIRLGLLDPADAREVVESVLLSQVVYLGIGGRGLDDDLIRAIAGSRYLANLRVLSLNEGAVTTRGLQALNHSQTLPSLITVEVTGNPCASDVTQLENGAAYWIAPAGTSWWNKARDDQFLSSDSFNPANLFWPPSFDKYAWTE